MSKKIEKPIYPPFNDPNLVAALIDNSSLDDPIQYCTYKSKYIYLHPLRYALTERENERHAAFQPGFKTKIKPVGLRLARSGYFYYIHSENPTKLHEIIITASGGFASGPLKLLKQGSIWVAFSEVSLSDRFRDVLTHNIDGGRNKFMQSISLGGFCALNGSSHLMPFLDAAGRIAETQPWPMADPLADQQVDIKPPQRPLKLECETEPFYWTEYPFPKIGGAVLEPFTKSRNTESAFILLNDAIGMMKDLSNYHGYIAEWEEEWSEKNQHRFSTASFIEGLYTYSFDEAKQQVDNHQDLMFPDKKLPSISEDDYELLIKHYHYTQRIQANQEQLTKINSGPHAHLSEKALQIKREIRRLEQEKAKIEQQLEASLGSDYQQVIKVFYQYANTKDSTLGKEDGLLPRIRNNCRLNEMESYLFRQRAKLKRAADLKALVVKDRMKLIPNFYKASWYCDPEIRSQHRLYSLNLYRCVNHICDTEEGVDFAYQFFMEDFGPQSMIAAMPTVTINWEKQSYEIRKILGIWKTAKTLHTLTKDTNELVDLLTAKDHVDKAFIDRMRSSPQETALVRATLWPAYTKAFHQEIEKLNTKASSLQGELEARFNQFVNNTRGLQGFFIETKIQSGAIFVAANEEDMYKALTKLKQQEALAAEINKALQTKKDFDARIARATSTEERVQLWRQRSQIKTDYLEHKRFQNAFAVRKMLDPLSTEPGAIGFKVKVAAEGDLEALRRVNEGVEKGFWTGYGNTKVKDGIVDNFRPSNLHFMILGLNIFNMWYAYEVYSQKTTPTSLDIASLGGAVLGLCSAITGFMTEIMKAGLRKKLELDQSPAMANPLARLSLISAIPSGAFNFLAAAMDIYVQIDKGKKAIKEGNHAQAYAALAKIAGDAAIMYGSGATTGIGLHGTFRVLSSAGTVSWLEAFTPYAVRLAAAGVWVMAGSIVVLVAAFIYEITHTPPLIKWVSESIWGNDSQGWDQQTSLQNLAEVIARPTVKAQIIRAVSSQPTRVTNIPQRSNAIGIHYTIECPGISAPRMLNHDASDIPIFISVVQDRLWEGGPADITDEIVKRMQLVIKAGVVALEFFFTREEQGNLGIMEWTIATKPDMAQKHLDEDYGYSRFQVNGIHIKEWIKEDKLNHQDIFPLKPLDPRYLNWKLDND